MTTLPTRLALATTALPLLLALGACGGSDNGSPQVASVPTSHDNATATPTGTATQSGGKQDATSGGRPVLRLDDTDQRRFALWNAHNKCLLEHGASEASGDLPVQALPGSRPGHMGIMLEQPVPKSAQAACVQTEPMGPLELDASTNPDFHDQSLAYVDCLRDHGEYVRLLNDHDIDWTYVEGHSVPDGQAVFEEQCLRDAFGAK